jgi:hypothetical protein
VVKTSDPMPYMGTVFKAQQVDREVQGNKQRSGWDHGAPKGVFVGVVGTYM